MWKIIFFNKLKKCILEQENFFQQDRYLFFNKKIFFNKTIFYFLTR